MDNKDKQGKSSILPDSSTVAPTLIPPIPAPMSTPTPKKEAESCTHAKSNTSSPV